MMVTAETQKGHIYYRCTKKGKTAKCSQPYLREESLENELVTMLSSYSLRADWADEMFLRAEAEGQQATQTARLIVEQKETALAEIASKQQKLLDAYLEGLVDRDVFTDKKAKLMGGEENFIGANRKKRG
jgi:site-specific DNA recombinase